ncbi:class I SAM-dependent methyltransferase [Marichromatium sp. AB32]|uniref:class I SAM-dependent methyltransferase n=1 Tax=Marichromatium sp. AB32 TaxID=2483363 RepID=UPI000F400CC8|nr:class I SAM-dependent methyltransferase [Marichromatium sp. AB32]RNE93651.1 class I SAM-dependent methyltransferase [Marichromatium sp. AB32]
MIRSSTLFAALEAAATTPRLIVDGHVWSGAALLEHAERLAARLAADGLGAGRRLHWRPDDPALTLQAGLACLQLGAELRLDPQAPPPPDPADLAGIEPLQTAPPDTAIAHPGPWFGAPRMLALQETPAALALTAALACWQQGGCVLLLPADCAPARVLGLLERDRVDQALIAPTRLDALTAHPAAVLADLDALERLFCPLLDPGQQMPPQQLGVDCMSLVETGDGWTIATPTARLEAEARALPELAEAVALERPGTTPRLVAVPAPARTALPTLPEDRAIDIGMTADDLDHAVALTERLARIALDSMLNALWRGGLFTDSETIHAPDEVLRRAGVAPAHRALVGRWLEVLRAEGLLAAEATGALRSTRPPSAYDDAALATAWTAIEEAWRDCLGSAETIVYARDNAARLPALLRDEHRAVHLLFPEGRTERAAALYRESVVGRYQHRAMAELAACIAAAHPRGRALRVLEVGAGTGATTEQVLPALAGYAVDYRFTDVSAFFLDRAAPLLAPYPWVRRGLHDIDRDPAEQGLAAARFDLILAGGVLNAARDTDASVRWLGELLAPGGWLLLSEPTREEYWVMASQALMLSEASDARADARATFLDLAQWRAVLDGAGLERVRELPGPDHPLDRLGHRVFATRRPAAPASAATLAARLSAPCDLTLVAHLPRTPSGAIDRARLARETAIETEAHA